MSAPSEPTADHHPATGENDAGLALAARLFDAARHGDHDALLRQALDAGLSADMANDKGDSLLMLAAYHGHQPTVQLLLDHGADPNALNAKDQSPLAGVVFKQDHDMAQLLLRSGADPDTGQPSAREAVGLFGLGEEWKDLFASSA